MNGAVLAWALLVLVFAMTVDSFAPADLLLGAVVSATVLLAVRRFLVPAGSWRVARLGRRLLRSVPLAGAVVRDIAVGTWRVALVVLNVRPLRRPGVVTVPFDERTPSGVALSALLLTLSPGESLLEIDWDRRQMLVHVIDASDPDAIRAHHRRFYRRFQRWVVP